jgi:hypothetical protein
MNELTEVEVEVEVEGKEVIVEETTWWRNEMRHLLMQETTYALMPRTYGR